MLHVKVLPYPPFQLSPNHSVETRERFEIAEWPCKSWPGCLVLIHSGTGLGWRGWHVETNTPWPGAALPTVCAPLMTSGAPGDTAAGPAVDPRLPNSLQVGRATQPCRSLNTNKLSLCPFHGRILESLQAASGNIALFPIFLRIVLSLQCFKFAAAAWCRLFFAFPSVPSLNFRIPRKPWKLESHP